MKSTQSDKGLGFDGAEAIAPKKSSTKFAGNQSGLTGTVNAGRGPLRGNDGTCHDPISGSKSAKGAPTGATGSAQYRGVGGTRVDKPARIDHINIEAKGTNGMGQSQAKNPIAAAKRMGNPDSFNYGPKSQY